MRGDDRQQAGMFSYVSPEERVPRLHPLRAIRQMTDLALKEMSPRFDEIYAKGGRPSIAPEKLLRALLLQVLYTIRSERMLMEQLDYNLLFRWFVGLNMDDPVWVPTVFTKNRDRLLEGNIAEEFFGQILTQARQDGLLSDEHFSVDGTLVEAWAGQKSFRKKDDLQPPSDPDKGNPTVDFHGEKRSNATHCSTTDPDCRLARKSGGHEAKLAYCGNVLMENRNGLVMVTEVLQANGTAERDAALLMAERLDGDYRMTLGADRGYDTRDFVRELRRMNITPHVAQNTSGRSSAIDGRTTRHGGYAVSLRKRKRIEEVFGWMKTVAGMRKVRHRGLEKVAWMFTFAAAAYNMVRLRNLRVQSAAA
ncbi:MAG TPA: IS5 family transposase [Bryobacteraceae bacterium]|nr:IS5 family transposase [Bryobacteraceae bacterium]